MSKAFAVRICVQIPRTYIKPGVVVCICNPSTPTMRWEAEAGESEEAGGPPGLMYIEMSKRLHLRTRWEVSFHLHTHAVCIYVCIFAPLTHIHMHTHRHTRINQYISWKKPKGKSS